MKIIRRVSIRAEGGRPIIEHTKEVHPTGTGAAIRETVRSEVERGVLKKIEETQQEQPADN